MRIRPGPPGSMGDLMRRVDAPFLFVDFRSLPGDHWFREPMLSGMMGYDQWYADWTRQVDAVFFTREMMPSTRTGLNPGGIALTVESP